MKWIFTTEKKAKEIYEITQEETIADDSGLCINCLNGFPGVMTHRFLGDTATDRTRNEYLINEVNKFQDRSAQVICNLVYYDGTNKIIGEGVLNGFISTKCRGNNGFGFDEIFELPNGLTLAELTDGYLYESLYRNAYMYIYILGFIMFVLNLFKKSIK